MTQTIVIALVLKYDRSFSELPGIVIDLYHIYHSPIIKNADKIYIITDMYRDEDLDVINEAFFGGIVNGDVLEIINTIRNAGNLYPYNPNPEWLINTLKLFLSSHPERVLFYYSGHGQEDHLLLPEGNKFMHADLRKLWLTYVNKYNQESVLIFDCCQGVDFKLPYVFHETDAWKLKYFNSEFRSQITVFNAAQLGQGAITENHGSLFTRSLFRALNKEPNLHEYKTLFPYLQKECYKLAHTGQIQTCSIQTNVSIQDRFPEWLIGVSYKFILDSVNELILINES